MLVLCGLEFYFFKQKTAYEMRISDWSSDVCSSDLDALARHYARHSRVERIVNGLPEFAYAPEASPGPNYPHVVLGWSGVAASHPHDLEAEIGRAACRDRVCKYV